MLARSNRLTDGRSFTAAVRGGRRAGRSTVVLHLDLRCAGSEPAGGVDPQPPRVGLVVGRSVGNAVTRNQVKRRLRHLVRDRLASLPGGTALVLRALPPAATASSAALGQDVDAALGRLLGAGRG